MGNTTITQLTQRMREDGFKITLPRQRILETLACATKPHSADEIHAEVPDINRVTVYRTLTALEQKGYVSRFTFQNKHVYELATTHSHYLVCKECEKIERIPSCTLQNIEDTSLKSSKNFASIDHHTLQLSGRCKQCV